MNIIAAGVLVVVLALGFGRPAPAQVPSIDHILSGMPGEYRRLHAYRVHERGFTMIVLDDDGTTSSVDMSAIGAQGPIELGQALTLAVKPGREPNTFIAGRVHVDPTDPSTGKIPRRPFDSVLGTIEAIRGGTIAFRTYAGTLLEADGLTMSGSAEMRVNDRAALTYERGPKRHVTALWLERQEIQPSAAVRLRLAGPGPCQDDGRPRAVRRRAHRPGDSAVGQAC